MKQNLVDLATTSSDCEQRKFHVSCSVSFIGQLKHCGTYKTKRKGNGKIYSLSLGFILSKFFSMHIFYYYWVKKINRYTEDFVL